VVEARSVVEKCPNCGANLAVSANADRFACEYCGATIAVQRRGDDVSLAAIKEVVSTLTGNSERNAAEMAVKRLSTELAAAEHERSRHDPRRSMELAPFDAKVESLGETQRGAHAWVDAIGVAMPALVWAAYGDHVPVIVPLAALVLGFLWSAWRTRRRTAKRLAALDSAKSARADVAARFGSEALVLRRRVLDVERKLAESKARAET
jgi:ribosomal protein S27AE